MTQNCKEDAREESGFLVRMKLINSDLWMTISMMISNFNFINDFIKNLFRLVIPSNALLNLRLMLAIQNILKIILYQISVWIMIFLTLGNMLIMLLTTVNKEMPDVDNIGL